MTFEYPIWLVIAPLIALVSSGFVMLGWRKRSQLLGQFAATRLLSQLTEKTSFKRRLLKSALIVAAITVLALSLSRPQYGVEWSERKARGLDIVFVLDSSKSMLATDLRPTRLERAKLAILDLIDRLESDRVGLVAFAGQAFLQTPPTLDYAAFRESLNATDPSILSRGGSDLGRAIEEAAQAFPSENNLKVVVLLTDGEDLGGMAVSGARAAAEEGIQIFSIGIGTPEGEYLRIRNAQGIEEFVRDADGQPVRTQLDEAALQQISQLTGGSYTRLSGSSLERFYESVLSTLPREERESELREVRLERFQWLLGAALILLILEILIRGRRSGATHATALVFALLVGSAHEAEASPYNQAHEALTQGKYAEANKRFTEAMRQTDDLDLQRDALYNMGHATYQLGREAYDEGDAEAALSQVRDAEKLFESALEIDPEDKLIANDLERARAVREAIENVLEEQKQQEQQQGEPQNQEQNEQEQEPDQSENEQASQSEESQNQDGQESQEQEGESGENKQAQDEPGKSGEEAEESTEQTEDGEPQESDSESPSDEGEAEQDPSSESEAAADESENKSERPSPGAEDEAPTDEEEASAPVPQVEEPKESSSGEESANAAGTQINGGIEGMSLEEAQDLLNSLRSKEEILPFAKPVPGKGRPLQDW